MHSKREPTHRRVVGKMQDLEAFCEITEFTLKVYLRIGLESVIGVSNSCDLAWIGLKSKHFRLKV